MRHKKYEEVLEKVGEQKPLEPEDMIVLNELIEKSLVIESSPGVYSLTPYGKVIQVMGYKSFLKTQELENDLSATNPAEYRNFKWILLLFFSSAIVALLLLFLFL